ncbi:MAG: divalent-cation tolerance protein CutA [Chloroflexi bacterium]|nr:divalent-cation tolerance protein CutA [Chloroflexota bacterium]
MPDTQFVVLFITTPSPEEGQRIADALLRKRRAACVNIVPQVKSTFWWQGKLDAAHESLLIVKTKKALIDDVVKTVREHHSYTVPEIIALPVIGGNLDYLDWLERETG